MPTILIVSPDPETAEMVTLAFELDGWKLIAATPPGNSAVGVSADVSLIDLPDRHALSEHARDEKGRDRARKKTLVLLPRGMTAEEGRRVLGDANLFVRRPFELTNLVARAHELAADCPRAAAKKKRPRRRS
jgi:DNA-binding response OmpR family regulator